MRGNLGIVRLAVMLGVAVGVVRAAHAPPTLPDCIEAVATGATKIRLSWKAVANVADGDFYEVSGFGPKGKLNTFRVSATKGGKAIDPVIQEVAAPVVGIYSLQVQTWVKGVGSGESPAVQVYVPGSALIGFEDLGTGTKADDLTLWPITAGLWHVDSEQLVQPAPWPVAQDQVPKKLWNAPSGATEVMAKVTVQVPVPKPADPAKAADPKAAAPTADDLKAALPATMYVGVGLNTDAKGNGYGLVFLGKDSVGFINDKDGAGGTKGTTVKVAGQTHFAWVPNQAYWFRLRNEGAILRGAIWPVCSQEPLGWTFIIDQASLVDTFPAPSTDSTARAKGVPALIAGLGAAAAADPAKAAAPAPAAPAAKPAAKAARGGGATGGGAAAPGGGAAAPGGANVSVDGKVTIEGPLSITINPPAAAAPAKAAAAPPDIQAIFDDVSAVTTSPVAAAPRPPRPRR